MAEERTQPLSSSHDGLVKACTCRLCNTRMVDPRVLGCLHSFCFTCLEQRVSQQVSEQKRLTCPVCNSHVQLLEGPGFDSLANRLRPDNMAATMTELLSAFKEDKSCDVCQRRQHESPAHRWCQDCRDALCGQCLQVHFCVKATSSHRTFSLSQLNLQDIKDLVKSRDPERCLRHPEELVKLFCLDCGQPVCVQCLAMDHKSCPKCVSVSEAKALVQEEVAAVMSSLTRKKGCKQDHPDRFHTSVAAVEAQVRSLAESLRQKVTECEDALLKELKSIGSQLKPEEAIGGEQAMTSQKQEDRLEAAHMRLATTLTYGSDLDILDTYYRVKDLLSEATGNQNGETETNRTVHLDLDETVKNLSRSLTKLGDIRVEDSFRDGGQSCWGVTVTAQDDIVVTDGRNKRVQKFTSSGTLVDLIQLSDQPFDLVSFGQQDVAVTVSGRKILLVSAAGSGRLDIRRSLDTQHQYWAIDFSARMYVFLVSSPQDQCVHLITTRGEVTKSFNTMTPSLEPVFISPHYVAFAKDGYYLVSDASRSSLIAISDQDDSVLFNYPTHSDQPGPPVRTAQGVCCDEAGNVFLADYGNSRIHLLTREGRFQRFIQGQETQLRRPVALAMTRTNRLVVVQSDGMVKIFSYEGQQPPDQTRAGSVGTSRPRLHSSLTPKALRDLGGGGRSSRSRSESSAPAGLESLLALKLQTFRSRQL